MQPKFAAFLALAAVAVQAAPEKRDSSSGNGFETITLPNGTPFIIPTGTVDVGVAASFVDANSGVIASVLGTETLLKLEASVAFVEAEEAIGAATTQLTAIVTTINSAPVVKVSSIGGKNEITIATGTKAVATTVFGGKSFTVVPNAAQQLASVPRGLWAGAAAVLGSMALGAVFVL